MTKSERNRKWYVRHLKRNRAKRRENYYKRHDYYLAQYHARRAKKYAEVFAKLVIDQNGLCGICEKQLLLPRIDHDHKSGFIRGLLCDHCNLGIGHFFDDVELLGKAAQYLKENKNGKTHIKYGT